MKQQDKHETTVAYESNMSILFPKRKRESEKKKIYANNYSTLYLLFFSHIHCPPIIMKGLNPHTKF